MNMPGFTAEAGLVSTAKTSWRVVAQVPMYSGVVPQVLEPVDEEFPQFGIKDFRDCYQNCRMMVDPVTGKRRGRFGCVLDCAPDLF